MRFWTRLLIGILVLLPLGLSASISFSPIPKDVISASLAAKEDLNDNETQSESNALQTLLEYYPWRGDLWTRLGRIQLDDGNYAEAVSAFEVADSNNQLSIEGTLWMADALISNHQPHQAKELLREVSNSKLVDPFTLLQAAILQRSINDPYGALATLLSAYTMAPLNSEINYQLGLQLSGIQPDSAIKFLQTAAQLNPQRQAVCGSLITMIEDSRKISGNAERYIYIGQILSNFGEWDIAQRTFQSAVEVQPDNAVAWALLAEAAQQNDQDGLQYITKAQELGPDEELVNGLSALYFRRQGKSELAISYLEKALDANPKASVWEIEIGNTLAEMGDLVVALDHYQDAVKIDPEDWAPYRAVAVFCITRNLEVEIIGLPAARQALALNPGSPALMDLLGTGLMVIGDLDSAERFFLQANEIDPHQSAILIHLGQLYIAKGDNEKAYVFLRQAVEFAKDNRIEDMALRILSENGVKR